MRRKNLMVIFPFSQTAKNGRKTSRETTTQKTLSIRIHFKHTSFRNIFPFFILNQGTIDFKYKSKAKRFKFAKYINSDLINSYNKSVI